MPPSPTRRELLVAGASASAAAFAGCLDAGDDNSATTDGDSGGPDSGPATTADTDGTAVATTAENSDGTVTPGDDLDLREANVTAVSVDCDSGECRFDVTLYHDDDGEDGYANWWQVNSRDGERLGRRDLVHAHGTREFTRSATIRVPEGISEVVVRGHDRTHGYGGQAMIVDLTTGETRAVRQGSGPDWFAE
ncbi:hypothetical protein [Halobaculum rubrum]|uniref:hypothetical protein n=1 Tax=Halobaculum rubrum TaxID=2872158 RepID=UPI001CA41F97|nr:hypothetical protein [Halobaculum rubrum]QZY00875.1 hypothetical protein K6T25_07400 [Halobaculum rubrum]